jgi:SAM-dependent methyltransferase
MSDIECGILQQLRNTPQIFARLVSGDESGLKLQKRLRDEFPADLVRAALTVHELRAKGAAKFSRADRMWFDTKGLEQSTAEAVALHKAQRFTGRVHDFCCGIGSDAIALARNGCSVAAVDLSKACCLLTQWNAECFEVADRIETTAVDVTGIEDRTRLLHVDPDRRPSGRRVRRVEDCVPGLEQLQQWAREFPGGAIKLSPASNFGGKFLDCEVELISLDGECREATIWFGDLAGDASYRATVLPSGESIAAEPLSAWTNVGELGPWLYDPDPAIVRSGLVDVLAEQLGLRRLDDAEEYLTGDVLVDSPFVRPFEVVENLPNNQREIRQAFRRHPAQQVEIKCRHIPIQAEVVRRKLPLDGVDPAVLIFTRQSGKARAVLCRRS